MKNLSQKEMNSIFINSIRHRVIDHSDVARKPLALDLKSPLPNKVRLYLYNVTHPTGGRTLGEHKIQLIVPGQKRKQRANFDDSEGRIVILAGYERELEVFVLWDAGLYTNFPFSRNVQVKAETIFSAFAGNIAIQTRNLKGIGIETVISCSKEQLFDALILRMEKTRERIMEGWEI